MASAELSEAGLPACNNIVLNPPKKIKTNNASNENTFEQKLHSILILYFPSIYALNSFISILMKNTIYFFF